MNLEPVPTPADVHEEVSSLIDELHRADRRLEELTGGEVDTVADGEGQPLLLRQAQEQLRLAEAEKQGAILNALSAHVALLDSHGTIVSVNDAWRKFAAANALVAPADAVGVNYLAVCDGAREDGAAVAPEVAAGIRAVLEGSADSFSFEYSCNSPAQDRWFLMCVTPLAEAAPRGAVVMHVNITERRSNEEQSLRFVAAMNSVADAIYLTDRASLAFVHVNDAACRMQGLTRAELIARGPAVLLSVSPAELGRTYDAIIASGAAADPIEVLRPRPDGSRAWVEIRRHAHRMGERWMIITLVRDITERRQASEDLLASENLKGAILEASLDSVVTLDHEGRITEFNPAAQAAFGCTREDALGRSMVDMIVPPRHRDAHRKGFARYLATGAGPILGKRIEIEALRADGREFPIELAITAIQGGATPQFAGFIRDITIRKETERKVKRLNRVQAVLSGTNALIVRARSREELLDEASRIAVEHGGFTMAWIAMVDKVSGALAPVASAGNVGDFFEGSLLAQAHNRPGGPGLPGRAVRELKSMVSNDVGSDASMVRKSALLARGVKSAAHIPLMVGGAAIGVLALYSPDAGFFDAEEMELLEELAGHISRAIDHLDKGNRLEYLAYYDALTGLPNRSLFLGRVAQGMLKAAGGGHKLALLLIDLERFKNINDTLGRGAGDTLLKAVAQWLKHKAGDTQLVAHLGADHFAVVLPVVRREGSVVRLLETTMKEFLDHPFELSEGSYRIGVRVGVALYPNDGANADALFEHAEAALKKAKAGGDRVLFYKPSMTEMMAGKLTLENQLRRALDNGEFVLHYQPKVLLASGKLTGAEALIRWNDPRTGLVPPGKFIPVLEETGLIHDVGRWALRQAIEDYLRWRAAGLPAVRVAVNVSPLQLRSRAFVSEIRGAVGAGAHAAAGLEVEITESLIMEDVKHSIATLQAVRDMDVTVAIDDFGTGFSSLSYLAKLPVDTVKIDRSFVNDMAVGPEGLALVSTIIGLAHSLRLNVVAEGVETAEQSRLLRLLDCDEMQGFLLSKAVPAEDFEARFLHAAPAAAA